MAFSTGSTVAASDYNALFTTLETIRSKHAARAGLTSTQKTKLADTTMGGYKTSVASGTSAQAANVTNVKNALNFLGTYAPNLTTTFASNIALPTAGTLLYATTLSTAETQINTANAQCANCSFNSSYNSGYNSGYNSSYNSGYCSGYNSSNFGSFNSSWNGVFC